MANPTTDNVSEAVALYLEEDCDCIIGFGGGSSMDCAKATGARIVKPKQSLAKMKGILKVHKKLPLLMAVPTTAGTGSETTLAAVITDAQTRHKYPINDFCLIPRYAVLDPKVTLSLPPLYHCYHRHGCSDSCGRSLYWKFYYLWNPERRLTGSTVDL